jgi:hypothetical protein
MLSPFKTALVTQAWIEYNLWTKPNGSRYTETDPQMTPNLRRYYAAVTLHTHQSLPTSAELQSATWHSSHYWSAAFISYLFFAAGAGNQFLYSLRHAQYVSAARNALHQNPTQHPFQAFPLGAVTPKEGDVLVRRRGGSTVNWGNLPADFAGHCDLVVDASQQGQILVIGGNVGMPGGGNAGLTVNKRQYNLDAGGFLRPAAVSGGIALLKNFKV